MKPLYRITVKFEEAARIYHIYADNEEEAKEVCNTIYKVQKEDILEIGLVS